MGISLCLSIDPFAIDPCGWAEAFDESLKLLQGWTPRLVGWGNRTVLGQPIRMYTRSIRTEQEDGWVVSGDRGTGRFAEPYRLRRDLAFYRRGAKRAQKWSDILLDYGSNPEGRASIELFEAKSQGAPYHLAMLAVSMLIEERFPRSAIAHGDIDLGQAKRARALAEPILRRSLAYPIRVDAEGLRHRLGVLLKGDKAAMIRAFSDTYLGGERTPEAILRSFTGSESIDYWLGQLSQYGSVKSLGATRLLIDWMNAERDLGSLIELACLSDRGPKFSVDAFVEALITTWVGIPPEVRDPSIGLTKREGEIDGILSTHGSMWLDMRAIGRHLRVDVLPQRVASAFSRFGRDGPRLLRQFRASSETIEVQLREQKAGIENLMGRSRGRGSYWGRTWIGQRSVDSLGEVQRAEVRSFGHLVCKRLEEKRGEAWVVRALHEPDFARGVLVQRVTKYGPILTEHGWEGLLRPNDPAALTWSIVLASLKTEEEEHRWLQRSLLENEELRRFAMACGQELEDRINLESRLLASKW